MIGNEDLLSEAEVQRRAQVFLLFKHPESTIAFGSIQRVAREGNIIFQLTGTLEIKSFSAIDRFLFRAHPNRFSFNIELDARRGKVLNYELR